LFELIAVAGTVALLGLLSLTGLGRSLFGPIGDGRPATPPPASSAAMTTTIGGTIAENASGNLGLHWKNLDCSKLTVVAYKAPSSLDSVKAVKDLESQSPVAQTVATPGPLGNSCVYSMKVPAGESLAVSVSSVKIDGIAGQTVQQRQKATDASVQVPGGSKSTGGDGMPELKLKNDSSNSAQVPGTGSNAALWIKGEVKTIKSAAFKTVSGAGQNVPLVFDLSESP
jgi:hypothetical protein